MKCSAGINGFGRFGLHLLKYWIENYQQSIFDINFINDDFLKENQILETIKNDNKVKFNNYEFSIDKKFLVIQSKKDNFEKKINITNCKSNSIPWIGKPEIFFECSGKNTKRENNKSFIKDKTKIVLISATSHDADKTLIYNYNHDEYHESHKIISYGSCTVNAYVPFADYINKKYSIINSDVNIVHNLPKYKILNESLKRRFCTLEVSGKKLLNFLNDDNFIVNYVLAPYTGISSIDLRFEVNNIPSAEQLIQDLEGQIKNNNFNYNISNNEIEKFQFSKNNIEIEKSGIKVIGKNIYIQGFFDNENSVNRYFDLANFLFEKIK